MSAFLRGAVALVFLAFFHTSGCQQSCPRTADRSFTFIVTIVDEQTGLPVTSTPMLASDGPASCRQLTDRPTAFLCSCDNECASGNYAGRATISATGYTTQSAGLDYGCSEFRLAIDPGCGQSLDCQSPEITCFGDDTEIRLAPVCAHESGLDMGGCGCAADSDCNLGDHCVLFRCERGCTDDLNCPSGARCYDNLCAQGCAADSDCSAGSACVHSVCEPRCTGDSGCATGLSYVAGVCRLICRGDGDCGAAQVCLHNECAGRCATSADCAAAELCCNGGCVDPASDVNYCGGCSAYCSVGDACCAGECKNIYSDIHNCGGCGVTCTLPHAAAICAAERCAIASCDPGFVDCNGDPGDGCESVVSDAGVDGLGLCGLADSGVSGD